MAVIGFIVAVLLFRHCLRRLKAVRHSCDLKEDSCLKPSGALSWHDEWNHKWADKFQKQAERHARHWEKQAERRLRHLDKHARRLGFAVVRTEAPGPPETSVDQTTATDDEVLRKARRRAKAEAGFYMHLMSYLGVLAFLALINIMTTSYPWFLWPALGWGIGLFSHYMAVFASHMVRQRYFEPAVQREVRREKVFMQTEKQASIEELSASIAHEIRNPIAAAKSLVQQMGEDPMSGENVEYAKVALDELDRVERRISHLLKYAKEEDYNFANANLASVVDSSLTQMRAKLDSAKVVVQRNYIGGPSGLVDAEKLRQVFANIIDNAIDALQAIPENRRIELFIENGSNGAKGPRATVRVRDNGCGIAGDKIDKIFNPFFTTKEKGTGLGMAISKKIVEAHEGTIDVLSEQGRGTEFVITLPLLH
ncbi:MAG: 2TM domain-containing protein [Deltaproteobacteria bacterium]|nr:2TM domain-containing protein [Deltaproteobacteria bacterium]